MSRVKTSKRLNLSSRYITALVLSLIVLVGAGGKVSAASLSVDNIYVTSPVAVVSGAGWYTNNAGGDLVWQNGGNPDPDMSAWAGYSPDLSSICSQATLTSMNVSLQVKDAEVDAPTTYTAAFAGLSTDGGSTLASINPVSGSGELMTDGFVPGFIERGYSSSNGLGATVADTSDNGPLSFNYTFTPGGTVGSYSGLVVLVGAETEDGPTNGSYLTTTEPSITITYDDSSCPQTSPPNTEPDISSGTPGQTTTANALTNDSDPDNDSLSITSVTIAGVGTFAVPAGGSTGDIDIPNVGTFSIKSNGEYSYTPLATFSGNYPQISYTISDGSSTATGPIVISVTESGVIDGDTTQTTTQLADTGDSIGVALMTVALISTLAVALFVHTRFISNSHTR